MKLVFNFLLGVAILAVATGCDTNNSIPVPVATAGNCGPGSNPESDMQGRIPPKDYESGRAFEGYSCNVEVVGAYTHPNAVDKVGGYKVERYIDTAGRECAYYDTTLLFPSSVLDLEVGINVMDMSDPTAPELVTRLVTPAMLSPHESLVVSQQGGVLAAVMGNPSFYPGSVDVYDISENCTDPQLRSSALVGRLGHESGIAPDGRTFYSASPSYPTLTAVDISNPLLPVEVWSGPYTSHGLNISNDGNRAYITYANGSGIKILDVSEIQSRLPNPQVREISALSWHNQSIPQNASPFTRDGHQYLLEIDEFSSSRPDSPDADANGDVVGAARIIDIEDETKPFVVSELRIAVHEPENRALIADDPGAADPTGGYTGHYCEVPTRVDPDIAACSMALSGLRIFDIRDPHNPREVAYYNAPPPLGPIPRSGFTSTNKAMSKPAFVPERKEIWYTDSATGFYVLRVTNGVW